MKDAIIHYHHIGGRGGTYSFPISRPFFKDISITLYDADASCCKNEVNHEYYNLNVLPYCIGRKKEERTFFITQVEPASSLFLRNKKYDPFVRVYPFIRRQGLFTECFHEVFSLKRMEKVQTYSLEQIAKQRSCKIDFLSLDVQGSVFDIIEGSATWISQNILGVHFEAELGYLYNGEVLHSKIHDLMLSLDYELIKIIPFYTWQACDMPIGWIAEGVPLDGEWVYVKRNVGNDSEKIIKQAFIYLVYGQFSRVISLMKNIVSLKQQFYGKQAYIDFIFKFLDCYQQEKEQHIFIHKTQNLIHNPSKNIKNLEQHCQRLDEIENTPLEELLDSYQLYDLCSKVKELRKLHCQHIFHQIKKNKQCAFVAS